MQLPIEDYGGLGAGLIAFISLWYPIYRSRITDTAKDLLAGHRLRERYVSEHASILRDLLDTTLVAVDTVKDAPNAGNTNALLKYYNDLLTKVEELDTIADVERSVIERMRHILDQVVWCSIGVIVAIALVMVGIDYPIYSILFLIVDFPLAEFIALYANRHVIKPRREVDELLDLLKERNIYTMGAD